MFGKSKSTKKIIEAAKVVCLTPDSMIRQMLHNSGFRNIEHLQDRMHLLEDVFDHGRCDILIMDDRIDGCSTASIVESIRRGDLGRNPFLPVITTIGSGSPDIVSTYVNAGSDDVVIKPLSAGFFASRVVRLVERQVEYVVTHDYLGPNRRSPERTDKVRDGLITVPNTLMLKANPAHINDDPISRAFAEVGDRRFAVQGKHITDLINSSLMSPSLMVDNLKGIKKVLAEFTSRSLDRDHQASKVCDVLAYLIDDTNSPTQTRNIELFHLLGEVLGALFRANCVEDNEAVNSIIEMIRAKYQSIDV